jgi:phosphatidylinositol 4-kinase
LAAVSLGSQTDTTKANGALNKTSKSYSLQLTGDILKLANTVAHDDISNVPITHKELEIIFALAQACPYVKTESQATDLFAVLSPYFLESTSQKFKSHLSLQLSPSPWDYLTKILTDSIVILGEKYVTLGVKAESLFKQYLDQFRSREQKSLPSYFSLIGFLKSLNKARTLFNSSIIDDIISLFNADFLDSIETATQRSLEDEHDFTYLLAYQASGDEFSALFFAKLVQKMFTHVLFTAIKDDSIILPDEAEGLSLSEYLLLATSKDYNDESGPTSKLGKVKSAISLNLTLVQKLANKAASQIDELDNGSPYINLSTPERVNLALETKSLALEVLAAGLVVDIVTKDELSELVTSSLVHPTEFVDSYICPAIISVGSLLTYKDKKNISGEMIHIFPLIISKISADANSSFIKRISRSLALGLKPLNQDSIITAVYSLVNLLVSNNFSAPATALRELKIRSTTNTFGSMTRPTRSNTVNSLRQTESRNSHTTGPVEDTHIFKNAISSVIEITKTYDEEAISVLTVTVLAQKFQYNAATLDFQLLNGLSEIATSLSEKEFLSLMKLFDNAIVRVQDDSKFHRAVLNARVQISKQLEDNPEHPLYFIYLNEMLNNVVSRGDVQNTDHRSQGEISVIAIQISHFIQPIAQLLPKHKRLQDVDDSTTILLQNFWFNIVVHGYNESSELTQKYINELEVIALNSPPLASTRQKVRAETSFELNTVLRRGSSNHNVKDQKHIISGVSNSNSLELRTLSYSKLMFLSATSLLETLRSNIGDCSTVLFYFSDPSIPKANVEKFLGSIAISVVHKYIKLTSQGGNPRFTSDNVASEMTKILILCCNRDYDLQDAAFQCASLLLSKLPSSLCNHLSLYTLLDMLTALFDSVVDSERSKYQPRREFTLKHSMAKITVSDSVKWKLSTLEKLHSKAREWCLIALNKCNQDMKALLQSYISELGFSGKVNEVQFGVSFAIELAGSILPSDLNSSNIFIQGLGKASSIAGFLSEYGWRAKQECGLTALTDDSRDPLAKLIRSHRGLMSNVQSVRANDSSFEYEAYLLLSEIVIGWQRSIKNKVGLFSKQFDLTDEGFLKMTYSPSDMQKVNYYSHLVSESFETDLQVIKFLISHFQGTMYQSEHLLRIFTRIAFLGLTRLKSASLHPHAKLVRFELINFGFDVLQAQKRKNPRVGSGLANAILDAVLSWFVQNRQYPYGDNDLRIKSDLNLLIEVFNKLQLSALPATNQTQMSVKRELALALLHDEISKMIIWLNPLDPVDFKGETMKVGSSLLKYAYSLNPELAFGLVDRFPSLGKSMLALISAAPSSALPYYKAVSYFLQSPDLYCHLVLAKPIDPTESINLFRPPHIFDPYIIQYNMRALEIQDINLTFFYIPQIVQCLLNDSMGYVARFIVEAGKVSQKYSHQLIWNLLANSENADLRADDMISQIIASYDDDAMKFYKTEFGFFDEVTSISGKLRAYLKKTKAEKKIKIDEEMKKIVVADNVYLPSNPDGVLVDINRTSGKPLQSHAKTPFMATFRIRKEEELDGQMITVEKWQSAIFKVGDDCRQDVLALQLISIFKSVWENAGLDLYCFPNRVTATAPGCGVIDVLPNSISRDLLGREAVNDLYSFFKSKFPDGILEYEDAVQNFVKSLAAYSIISYLLQFKDRHNGNIMYDDRGHILHIDFGFCFDIVPGGVKFEACPFKLTKEMVRVMGGSKDTESFRMFEELFIKGFLAMRPYYSLIVGNVEIMLASGLPCFKGEKTIRNLKARFFLDKDDKQCIKALRGLIRESYESIFSLGYDKFQKMTNGIPY